MAIRYIEQDRTFWLDTEHTSYLLAIVDQENFVGHVYYGQKLQYTENTPAPVYLLRTGEAPFVPSQNNRERVSFLDSFPMEYPGNGLGDYRESAISVRTAQGHVGVQLQYVSHEIVKEKPALPGLPSTFPGDEDCDTLILHLADPGIGLAADLTSHLCRVSQAVNIALMYIGRVGPVTIALLFAGNKNQKDKMRTLQTNIILVG